MDNGIVQEREFELKAHLMSHEDHPLEKEFKDKVMVRPLGEGEYAEYFHGGSPSGYILTWEGGLDEVVGTDVPGMGVIGDLMHGVISAQGETSDGPLSPIGNYAFVQRYAQEKVLIVSNSNGALYKMDAASPGVLSPAERVRQQMIEENVFEAVNGSGSSGDEPSF